jgi:serine/threonine protein kinase
VKPLSDEALAQLAEAASRPVVPGGRYEVVERVGAGGMGTVYRARDRELARDVALKVVHDTRAPAALAECLFAEARTVAALEHSSVPPVHEVGTLADGRAYYVMRFVRGTTLTRVELGGRNAALRLFLRLCDAVAHAHARGVVHRDLKPENVMLGEHGELFVMDWGLAGALAATGERTAGAGGTPGFMAPEEERAGPVDARADVYALGGILVFLVSGRGPTRDGAVELAGLPRPLAAIVRRARAREPGERYPSALELARDVAAFLDRAPVGAYREGPLERGGRFLVKHQFVAWLVVGYLTLRALILVLAGR